MGAWRGGGVIRRSGGAVAARLAGSTPGPGPSPAMSNRAERQV